MEVLLKSADAAESAFCALDSESGSPRARLRKRVEGKKLLVSIEAKDAVAFRALANSVLRCLQVIEGMDKIK